MSEEIIRIQAYYLLCDWIAYFGVDNIVHWLQGIDNLTEHTQHIISSDSSVLAPVLPEAQTYYEQKHHDVNRRPGQTQLELW